MYHFGYDSLGRQTTVSVGSHTLSTTAYNADGTTAGVTYGNGGEVRYSYDEFQRLEGIAYDNETGRRFTYHYGNSGEIGVLEDHALQREIRSEYDLADRPMRKSIFNTANSSYTHIYTGTVSYDQYNNLSRFRELVGSGYAAYQTEYSYDAENRPVTLQFGSTRSVTYAYDALGRTKTRTLNIGGGDMETEYKFVLGGYGEKSRTALVNQIIQLGQTLYYAYDDCGNITEVLNGPGGSLITGYVYDDAGQLVRVNDTTDKTASNAGTTWFFTHDNGGNILTRTAYPFTDAATIVETAKLTDVYTYQTTGWKDQLVSIERTVENQPTVTYADFTYDEIGNPEEDGTWEYIWQHGRQLAQMGKDGETVSFVYNEDGLRVRKTATSTGTTEYYLHGKNIVPLTNGNNRMHFYYDAQGRVSVVLYNGTAYGYIHNLQGDVIALVNASGTKVVEYTYDAWGRPTGKAGTLAGTLGTLQPFRYRGYVWDEETGLYYLRSRYYRPEWGRFVNADNRIGQSA